MNDDERMYENWRTKMLTLMFALLLLAGLFVVFTILTGGFLLYILLVVVAVAALAGLQYLVWTLFARMYWGRSLSEYIEEERQEMNAREPEEDVALWEEDDPRRPRHF